MHLVTDCKEALREAVSRPSERISPLELSAEHAFKRDIITLDRVQKQVQAVRCVHANAAVKSAVSAGETFFFWRVSFCFFLVSPGGLFELAEEQL